MSLRVSEIFTSIQGEGKWVGVPSVFFRVSGCNLRCVWCDTPYASWHPEGELQTIDSIFDQLVDPGIDHVVITGGEPMIFPEVAELCSRLKSAGKVITIETAGTAFLELDADLMSISPKLANSMVPGRLPSDLIEAGWEARHEARRLDRSALTLLSQRYNCQLKFVVDCSLDIPSQLEEISEVLQSVNGAHPVYLMPEGRDAEHVREGAMILVPYCLERNWRLGLRLQLDLFGDTRGT